MNINEIYIGTGAAAITVYQGTFVTHIARSVEQLHQKIADNDRGLDGDSEIIVLYEGINTAGKRKVIEGFNNRKASHDPESLERILE